MEKLAVFFSKICRPRARLFPEHFLHFRHTPAGEFALGAFAVGKATRTVEFENLGRNLTQKAQSLYRVCANFPLGARAGTQTEKQQQFARVHRGNNVHRVAA